MIEKPVRGVAHRPDRGELIVHLGEFGQDFGEVNPRDLGRNGLEGRTDLIRDVFLGIPEVEMTRPPLQVEQDHALGLAPAIPACMRTRLRLILSRQDVVKGHPHHASSSHTEEVTTGRTEMGIAQIAALCAFDTEHI